MKKFTFALSFGVAMFSPSLRARDFDFFQPLNPPRRFQVMVHRGEAGQAPENTRSALTRCIEDGLEWAEIDLRLTKDGHHVLSHDATVDGKSNGKGFVKDLSLEELKKLDAGSWFAARYAKEQYLTIEECFEIVKGKLNLYLDCKEIHPEQLVQDILKAGMEKQVIVFDDPPTLKRVREASGGKVAVMPKWHPANGTTEWIEKIQPDAVEIDAPELTPEIARTFHEKGIKVQTKNLGEWDKPEFWDKVISSGVDWIQTDLPEEIIARDLWRRIPKRPVRISLHRGANRYAPENTVPAFEKAIRLGADFVEFDVRTTKDGKLFLMHDGRFNRTTNVQGDIAQSDSKDVAPLDVGAWFGKPFVGVKIPSLDDFLTAVQGKVDLYFDAKAIAPESLAEAVERYHMAERTIVYQGPAFLKKLKAIDPKIRALPPLDKFEEIDAYAEDLKPYAVDARWNVLSKEMIAHCHERGILVFSDSIGAHEKIEDYLQAMDWGIDLIQTDHPLRVMRAIELLARRNDR